MDPLRLILGERPDARRPVVRCLAGASFWGASASMRQASKIGRIERAGLLARQHKMRKTLSAQNIERDCEKKVT